ncbi:Uncharacterised protein [Klebsiella quasipneumoniae]|nr:Uncharacterised protein [Klebsiella quasipneumoniae]
MITKYIACAQFCYQQKQSSMMVNSYTNMSKSIKN